MNPLQQKIISLIICVAPDPSSEDGKYATSQTGKYNGNEEILLQVIGLFSLNEKVQLVVDDGRDTIPKYEKENY